MKDPLRIDLPDLPKGGYSLHTVFSHPKVQLLEGSTSTIQQTGDAVMQLLLHGFDITLSGGPKFQEQVYRCAECSESPPVDWDANKLYTLGLQITCNHFAEEPELFEHAAQVLIDRAIRRGEDQIKGRFRQLMGCRGW